MRRIPLIIPLILLLVLVAFLAAASTGILGVSLPKITIGEQPTPTPVVVVATPQPGRVIGPQPYSDITMVIGREDRGEDSEWINGFNIRNSAQAKMRDAYRVFASYVGAPVGPYERDCQVYQFGKLCYDSTQEPWHVSLDNIGLQKMRDDGFTPDTTNRPHPALKAWMDEAASVGMTQERLTGPMISPPDCKQGWCVQYTHRFLFVIPDGATKASEVKKAPLGLMSLPKPVAVPTPAVILVPQPAPTPPKEDVPWSMIGMGSVIAALLVVVGYMLTNSSGIRRR